MALWDMTDTPESKPKYLSEDDKAKVIGVDVAEAAANRKIGINTPGWVKYETYTDATGAVRHKSEVLVAAASMTGDDPAEDPSLPETALEIVLQPQDGVGDGVEAVELTVGVAVAGADVSDVTYQWQEYVSDAWADVAGETTDTLSLTDADDSGEYRVVVTLGDIVVESDAATVVIE